MELVVKELHKCYSEINNLVFEEKLPKDSVLLVLNKSMCSKNQKWELNDKQLFQLAISVKAFSKGRDEFLESLLIQMAHLKCKTIGVKDVQKGKCTEEFKLVCDSIGLTLLDISNEETPVYDDNSYIVTQELKDKLSQVQFDESIFDLKIIKPIKGASSGGGTRKPTYKYKCPCDKEIKSSIEDLHVVCKECNEEFIAE
jgi:hypothetical protein